MVAIGMNRALMHAAERGQTKVITALLSEFKADPQIRVLFELNSVD
jgi:hypothetical protein